MTMVNDQSATLMPHIVLTYSTHVLVQASVFVLIISTLSRTDRRAQQITPPRPFMRDGR